MSFYPSNIADRVSRPNHCGRIEAPEAVGTGASFECGSFVRVSLSIDPSATIAAAKYRSNGCGYMIAAAEVMSEWLRGKELTALGGLNVEIAIESIESQLGKLPENRVHCTAAAIEAFKAALSDYRAHRLEEFRGEKALICTCFGVGEEEIAAAISEHHLTEVTEVSKLTRAGSGCGACWMLIQELIDSRFDQAALHS